MTIKGYLLSIIDIMELQYRMTWHSRRREEATREMIQEFVERYYTYDDGSISDYHIIWDWGLLGIDVICVREFYYRNIQNIREALHHNIPEEKLFERYDYQEQLNLDSNGEKSPTNLVSFWKWADKIGLTEEEMATHKEKMKNLLTILDEEIEKNKSEEYKAKEEKRKREDIQIWNEEDWYKRVNIYDVKQALKKYHIDNGESCF